MPRRSAPREPSRDDEPSESTETPDRGAGGAAAPLFYSEEAAAALLGIHRTTLRNLALDGKAPVEPVTITDHKRVYRRIDIERLAGVAE